MNNTLQQYEQAIELCRDIFYKKTTDYGTSWRVLRPISIVDQIYIKAQRIRTIQLKKDQKVSDSISGEFIGMVNYAVIGLIQLQYGSELNYDDNVEDIKSRYETQLEEAGKVMQHKNHDYGEAWREMSQESFVDLILMKLMRMKQIISNDGKTLISEGMDANYIDIINYSLFALILIGEGKHNS